MIEVHKVVAKVISVGTGMGELERCEAMLGTGPIAATLDPSMQSIDRLLNPQQKTLHAQEWCTFKNHHKVVSNVILERKTSAMLICCGGIWPDAMESIVLQEWKSTAPPLPMLP